MAGILNRAALREEVLKNLGDRPEIGSAPVITRANRHLDLAQLRIARAYPPGWRELNRVDEVSVTALPQYLWSGSLRHIYSLRVKEDNNFSPKLIEVDQRTFDQLLGVPETQTSVADHPTHYTIWDIGSGWLLDWYPVPSDDFVLVRRYAVWPSIMSSDISFPDLRNKDDILIALATSTLFDSLGNKMAASKWFANYSGMLRDAVMAENVRPDLVIRPTGAKEESALQPNPWADPFVRSFGDG